MHVCLFVYMQVHLLMCVCIYVCLCLPTSLRVCIHACTCVFVCMCMNAYVYLYVHTCASVWMCAYVHICAFRGQPWVSFLRCLPYWPYLGSFIGPKLHQVGLATGQQTLGIHLSASHLTIPGSTSIYQCAWLFTLVLGLELGSLHRQGASTLLFSYFYPLPRPDWAILGRLEDSLYAPCSSLSSSLGVLRKVFCLSFRSLDPSQVAPLKS